MNLSNYQMTPLEIWISNLYQENGIENVSDLSIDRVSEIFNIKIGRTEFRSHVYWDDKLIFILLNEKLTEQQKRAEFFHELCHPLRHYGNQRFMAKGFIDLQEIQASHFQIYAAMPFYLVAKLMDHSIQTISEEFVLPKTLIQKRMDQIKRRIFQAELDLQYMQELNKRHKKYDPSKWSDETKRIMEKLNYQLKRRSIAKS